MIGRRARRGLAYVEILVIVGVVLTLGALAIRLLGGAMDAKADQQADCIRSFACGEGAGTRVAVAPSPAGGDGDADPALWGSSAAELARAQREGANPRYPASPASAAIASAIVAPTPTGASAALSRGRANVVEALSHMPPRVLDALRRDGVQIRVAEGKIEGALPPELRSYHPPAYPPGVNLGDAAGVYLSRTATRQPMVLIAVDPNGKPLDAGSINALYHEVGHAYDNVGGVQQSAQPRFVAARGADIKTGGVPDGYFLTRGEGGNQTAMASAQTETYAESFASYYRNSSTLEQRDPNLYNYLRARDPEASWASRAWAWWRSP